MSLFATDRNRDAMAPSTAEAFDVFSKFIPSITRGATINICNCFNGLVVGSLVLAVNRSVPLAGVEYMARGLVYLGAVSGFLAAVQLMTLPK